MRINKFVKYTVVVLLFIVVCYIPLHGFFYFLVKTIFFLLCLIFLQFFFRTDDFFQSLNYCSCNEDWRSEWRALKIEDDDRILCVTGSGDRPLNLLVENPSEVVSIDMNTTQNNLLRLKIEAIRYFSYEDFVKFMGFRPCSVNERRKMWKMLMKNILERKFSNSKEEERMKNLLEFWNGNSKLRKKVMKGIIYQGRWEGYFKMVSMVVGLLVPDLKYKAFEFDDLDEQRIFVKEKLVNNYFVKILFQILCSNFFSKLIFKDPGFYKHTSKRMTLGSYIYDKIINFLEIKLCRESFMLSLCFRGKLSDYDVPPYLDERYYETIKNQLDKISIVNENLLEFLHEERNEGMFDKFSLSDVPSFLDNKGFNHMLSGCVKSSKGVDKSRIHVRFFYSDQKVDKKLSEVIERNEDLEELLALEDTSIGYRFLVGVVKNK